jgi:hypothetical protein
MLEKLKAYKEMLAIIVFFLGGLFWIQNQFPTKTDLKTQIGILNCLLDKYMVLTQRQIRSRDLERQQLEITAQINLYADDHAPSRPPISPAMLHELDAKRQELIDVRRDLKTNADEIQKTSDELARNLCGGKS